MSNTFSQPLGDPNGPASPYAQQMPPQGPPPSSGNGKIVLIVLAIVGGVMFVCCGILGALMYPAIGAAKQAAQRMNNAKMISLGIHNYHSAFKQLPMTVSANSEGEETIGWRVGLSPFVEGQSAWEATDSTQSWDSDANVALVDLIPLAFQKIDAPRGETGIFAIVSENSMFLPTPLTTIRFRDVLDGLSNTAMAIELPNRSVLWNSNENMTPDEAYEAITELEPMQMAHLLMGDGAVKAVGADLDRELFDAMMSVNGREELPFDF